MKKREKEKFKSDSRLNICEKILLSLVSDESFPNFPKLFSIIYREAVRKKAKHERKSFGSLEMWRLLYDVW